MTTDDLLAAFKILQAALESLAILRIKISEQKLAEAREVTPSGNQSTSESTKFQGTIDMLRSRFLDKSKANYAQICAHQDPAPVATAIMKKPKPRKSKDKTRRCANHESTNRIAASSGVFLNIV